MQTGYAEDDLADGRAALLSGWRIGFTLYGSLAVEMAMKPAMANRPGHTGPWLARAGSDHRRVAGLRPAVQVNQPAKKSAE
jgi:hypothetical protein